jgi:hypothetical protein
LFLSDLRLAGLELINLKTMKNIRLYLPVLFVLLAVTMTSCDVIADIFKAGMWTALIIIVLIVALVGWLFSRFRR